jgi:hypothetical protein
MHFYNIGPVVEVFSRPRGYCIVAIIAVTNICRPLHILTSGQVAFITGGWYSLRSVELYSPNGDCQHQLAPLPIDLMQHVIDIHNNVIIVCGGMFDCFLQFYRFWNHMDSKVIA